MINHTVLWTMKSELEDKNSQMKLIRTELLQLKDKVSEILSIEVKTNDPAAAKSNFDIALISTFADLVALDRYQKHPEHLKAGQTIKELISSRAAIDYFFEKQL